MKKIISLIVFVLCISNVFSSQFVPNTLYVKFKSETNLNLSYANNTLNVNKEATFFNDFVRNYQVQLIQKAFKTKDENVNSIYKMVFTAQNSMLEIINFLEKQKFVEYAEKIPIYELFYTPNDAMLAQQWNLNTIQAEQAWNISTGSQSINVAVTDNAVLTSHQDLINNIFTNQNEIAGNGIDDDNNGYIDDVNGWDAADNDNNPNPINLANDHGTHVSGIVAATTDNTIGIASIGFNVKIIPVKIGTSPSGILTGAFDGLDYAISCGYTDVINMSWGGANYSSTMQNLLNAGHNANIVLVAAAGNSNTSAPMYPAAYNHVISVGATTSSDQRAYFSNYGSTIDVMAPGHLILSCENSTTNDAYGVKSGTSMASPLVAGLCGLILSNSPNTSPTLIENCIESTCDNIDAQNPSYVGQIGAGRINAFQAMQCFNAPPVADFSSDFTSICANQSIQFTDMSGGTNISSWLWDFGDGTTSSLQNPSHQYTSNGTYTVSLTVTNSFGTDTETKTNFINIVNPSATLSGSNTIIGGSTAYLQINFTGNPPFSFTYTDGTSNFTQNNIASNFHYFPVSPTSTTTYSLVSMADNDCTGTGTGTATIQVQSPPVVSNCNTGQLILRGAGDDDHSGIIELQNGNLLFVGTTESYGSGGKDLIAICFAPDFSVVWQKTYGGSGNEEIITSKCLVQIADGSISIRAETSSFGNGGKDFLLFNINSATGIVNWSKTYGGSGNDFKYSFAHTQDGGYLLGGRTHSFGAQKSYLVKTDASGNMQWNKVFSAQEMVDVVELSDGSILVSGGAENPSSSSAYIIKLNASGVSQWSKVYTQSNAGIGQEAINGMVQKSNGNVITSGITRSLQNFGGTYDALIMEINPSNGNVVWAKINGSNGYDSGFHPILNSFGELIIPFYQNSVGFGNYDFSAVKLDAIGNIVQSKSFGSFGYEYSRSIGITSNNKLISSSITTGLSSSARDILISKTNSNWSTGCNEMNVVFQQNTIAVTPTNYTYTQSTGGTSQTINLVAQNVNAVLDTLCINPCTPDTIVCENKRVDTLLCKGNALQLNADTGQNYNWFPKYNLDNDTIKNPTITSDTDTLYTVSYTDTSGCSRLDSFFVEVKDLPIVLASPNDTTVCPTQSITLLASGASQYVWTPSTGLNNATISNPIASPSGSMQYVVSGIDIYGCENTDTVTINVLPCCGAFADFNLSDSILCVGESINITNLSAVNNPATHSWSFTGGSPSSFIGQNPPMISYATPGTYEIEYVLNDACGIDTLKKKVYVFDLPSIEIAQDTALCDSTTFMYSLGGASVADYSYSWSPSTGLNNAQIANPTATINSSINYIVSIVDNFTGCTNADSVSIQIGNPPENFIESDLTNYCMGDTILVSSSFVFDSLLWYGSINAPNLSLPVNSDTILWAVGYLQNCSSIDTMTILADTIPDLSLNTNDTSICSGDTAVVTAQSLFPVQWNTTETANSIAVSPNLTTYYFVSALNGNCSHIDSVLVNVSLLPNVTLLGPDTTCVNTLINLTATGATNYSWINAQNLTGNTNNILVESDTSVFVEGTTVCPNTDTLFIYAVDSVTIEILGDDTICEGQSITLEALSSSPNFIWNTGESSQAINHVLSQDSIFSVIAQASYCPNAEDEHLVTVKPLPTLSVVSPVQAIQGENIILETNSSGSFIWNPIDGLSCVTCPNPSLVANESIMYYVENTIDGCVVRDSILVEVKLLDECIAIPTAFSPNGDNLNDVFFPISKTNEIKIRSFRIYNRWGEKIHDGPFAWDGKYKEKDQNLGVYVYYVEYTCNKENKKSMGNITLVR